MPWPGGVGAWTSQLEPCSPLIRPPLLEWPPGNSMCRPVGEGAAGLPQSSAGHNRSGSGALWSPGRRVARTQSWPTRVPRHFGARGVWDRPSIRSDRCQHVSQNWAICGPGPTMVPWRLHGGLSLSIHGGSGKVREKLEKCLRLLDIERSVITHYCSLACELRDKRNCCVSCWLLLLFLLLA